MIFNEKMAGGRERVTTDEKRYCKGVGKRSSCEGG